MNREIRLGEVLADIEVIKKNAQAEALAPDLLVKAVTNDSRTVTEGSLFFAVSGFETDGHRFAGMAKDKGAVAAVTERLLPELDLPQFVVADSRRALAFAAAAFNGHPSESLHVTGITGSNGKTSCSLMLKEIYNAAGIEPGLIGTVMYSSKKVQKSAKLTTPDPVELQALFAEMKSEGMKDVIMEVSSIGHAQCRDLGTAYDVVAFINISREHIDYHGSFENYFAAKKDFVMSAGEKAFVVLNADDPKVSSLRDECPGKVITFGFEQEADVKAENLDMTSGFPHFDLCISKRLRPGLPKHERCCRVALSVPGYHSMMNALAAAAMALASHLPPEAIIQGLTSYRGVERRFQNIYNGEFMVFDDHFANPGNIRLSLETLTKMRFKKLHLLYAIRGSRGVTVCRESLEELFKFTELLEKTSFYATLSSEVVSHYNKVTPEELSCFREMMEKQGIPYTLDERLEDAVSRVLDHAERGDVILLAGCQGMDAGARLLLEELAARHPAWSRDELMAPVADRVCGRPGELA